MTDPAKTIYACQNCDWTGADSFEAEDIHLRMQPGDIYTDRSCPECGALVHPKDGYPGKEASSVLIQIPDVDDSEYDRFVHPPPGMKDYEAVAAVEALVRQIRDDADEDGGEGPTEQELRTIYAQAKKQAAAGQQGQEIPPFAEVRDQIEEQAKTEQTNKVASALVEDLRKDADITINL